MATDSFPLRRIDHVRFFVGNARQSAYFYRNAFGFDVVAYAGLETRSRHEAGYVLRQGEITFVLTSSLRANDPDNMRLIFHGDGVEGRAAALEEPGAVEVGVEVDLLQLLHGVPGVLALDAVVPGKEGQA